MEQKTELQRNFIETARRKELESFQRALDIKWLDSRMADGGMSRCLALIQREAEMEKQYQERTDHAAIVNNRVAKEVDLGVEIAKIEHEKICELQRRHYLRERDPTLRELARKLQAGYVCRDLKQQILHNEYRRLQEKVDEDRAYATLQNSLYNDGQEEYRLGKIKLEETSKYRKELQQQLVDRQTQRQCQYEDTLIEKKMLDEIMRTISDEDMRELKQKQEQTAKLCREMVTFKQAREAWKAKHKQMLVNEEREIEEQAKAQSDRSSAIVAERERKMRVKEENNAKICAKILAEEAERVKREDLIKLLQEQEYLEKCANDDVTAQSKRERVKRETREALTAQMEVNKRLENEQKYRDVALRKENEAKFNADIEKENEKQRKLRESGKLYSQELRRQMEANASRREKEKQFEDNRAQYVWDFNKKWEQEVSRERSKIIQDHAPQLLGSVQAGVLRVTDLPDVREGANKRPDLRHLDIESMAVSDRPKRFAKCNAQCRVIKYF